MSYIEFRDVKKTYHVGEVDIHALAGASFQVEKGEFSWWYGYMYKW